MCPRTRSGGAVIGLQLCCLYRLGSYPTAPCVHTLHGEPPRTVDPNMGLRGWGWRVDFEL